jgi:hypothetical protein
MKELAKEIKDIMDLKNKVETDEITVKKAHDIINKIRKPWERKEWKVAREELIKGSCQQCETKEGPFTLQHTKGQFRNWDLLYRASRESLSENRSNLPNKYGFESKTEHYKSYLEEKEIKIPDFILEKRKCCPKCKSVNIRYYKTLFTWKCHAGSRGCTKDNKFEAPLICDVENRRLRNDEKYAAYKSFYDLFYSKDEKDMNNNWASNINNHKEEFYKCIEDTVEYLSLKNTETWCKKCAFLKDEKGKILCECKRDYREEYKNYCFECQIDKKEVALCKSCEKSYHKSEYNQCYRCKPRSTFEILMSTNLLR